MDAIDVEATESDTPTYFEFARALRVRRAERGFSQKLLAERSTLTQTRVSRLERGAGTPNIEECARIEDGLQLPRGSLLVDSGYYESRGRQRPGDVLTRLDTVEGLLTSLTDRIERQRESQPVTPTS
ncbi:MAG TPA: helix-turn-helix transcriptional regulator [Acidimicrobiia bacterium]|nr:helix-turn-helix transcriptional regulator [Acidimicrobiia bacterium]